MVGDFCQQKLSYIHLYKFQVHSMGAGTIFRRPGGEWWRVFPNPGTIAAILPYKKSGDIRSDFLHMLVNC